MDNYLTIAACRSERDMGAVTHIEQRTEALKRANLVRTARAARLHDLYELNVTDSHLLAADLIENVPPEFETLQLVHFLMAIRRRAMNPAKNRRRRARPYQGRYPARVSRLIRDARASEFTHLSRLAPQQRDVLTTALRKHAEDYGRRSEAA